MNGNSLVTWNELDSLVTRWYEQVNSDYSAEHAARILANMIGDKIKNERDTRTNKPLEEDTKRVADSFEGRR